MSYFDDLRRKYNAICVKNNGDCDKCSIQKACNEANRNYIPRFMHDAQIAKLDRIVTQKEGRST